MAEQARFVVLEGLDGAGTTTQTQRLAAALEARGTLLERTSEPSDGPIGRLLREHIRGAVDLPPEAAAFAFTADRADHLERVVRPALRAGRWVVCDRYLLSTLAYQGAEGVDPGRILAASRGFDVPDLTVVLEVPADRLVERVRSRAAERGAISLDRYERPDLTEALLRMYRSSVDLLREEGHRIAVLDGDGASEEVAELVLAEVAIL